MEKVEVDNARGKPVGVADYLMDLSAHLVQSLNTRTVSIVFPMYMAPSFSGFHSMDQTPLSVTSRDEIIAEIEGFLQANPKFYTKIVDMSADIEPNNSCAKVWIRRTDTGLEDGRALETLMQFSWTLRDGEWLCEGYQGVRSFPFYGGSDEPAVNGL
jgi:hypothetical protein